MQDFKREVQNLDYIKESLTDSKRVMKHIAAIVHGNELMILLPHADLFDLEVFLRGGFDPDPSTVEQRMVYDFDAMFPMLNTPVVRQHALVEEIHQLASALKWLHEDLKIFGSYNQYLAHMDLKPANVLLVGDDRSDRSHAGKWMLSDFGVSSFDKATNVRVPDTPSIRDVGYRLTSLGFQDRIVRGHGPYQPPEVDLENVDCRKCDVWSLGCIMCDVLAFAIGGTELVHTLRDLRYDGGDDYFYRKKAPLRTEINNSNTELKPQIVQWWKNLTEDYSSPRWATEYVNILCKALKIKPSDRPDVADIVRDLDELAPSITPHGTLVLDPESESLSSQSSSSGEGQGDDGMISSDTSEPRASPQPPERRISNFLERPKKSVSPPKKDKVRAVAVNPSPLQVAILCRNAVHFYLFSDGEEEIRHRHIDLTPKVDWKKIRLASHYFAVYGVGSSNKKIVS